MAESRQELVIEADVGRAQRGLDELAQASRGVTTAVENAGAGMKAATAAAADLEKATNAQKEAADKLRRETAAAAQIIATFGRESKEAKEALERVRLAQEAAAKASKAQAEATTRAAKATAELGEAADGKAQASVKRLNVQLERAAKDADKAATDLRGLEARIHSLGGAADKSGGLLGTLKKGLAFGAAAGAAAGGLGLVVDAVKGAAHFAVSTGAEFERLRTALETTTGSSSAAAEAFSQISKFAASTPFSLQEVTDGFIKLKNRGLDPSEKALTAYGDTASAMGKSLDDMVEAVADATTGEFERLKEFGVRASKNGDRVSFTFRGMTKEVAFSSREIEKYLVDLGRTNFAGGMEKQSKTLVGVASTLADTAAQFADTVMQSGVAQVLKDIMGEITAGAGGASDLAKSLGGALADGLRLVASIASGLGPILGAVAKGFSFVVGGIADLYAAHRESIAALQLEGKELATAEERLTAYARANGGALGPVGELMRQHLMSAEAQDRLTRAIRETQRAREDEARTAAVVAGLKERNDRTEAARLADLEKRKISADKSALMAEYNELKSDKTLTPSQRKRKLELEKTLDIEKEAKVKKGPSQSWTRGASLGAAERYEERERAERERAFAASVKAYDKESAARERRIDGLGREIELLEARGIAERDQVDVLLWSISIESEAEAKREALIDARIAKEEELARFQVRAARTEEQREKARTRLEEAQHQARLRVLQRTAAAEEREHAKRARVVEGVAEAVMTLGEGMLDAFEKMAAGQRGAIAEMLADQLKSIARTHAVLALGETAKGIAATAMTWGIPNPEAGAHFAAAAAHGAVAVAAGVGGFIAGHVADARQGGGGGGGGASPFGGASGGGGSSLGGSGGSRPTSQRRSDLGDVEAEDIPISSEQARRGDPSMRRGQGGAGPAVSITINGPVVGDDGFEKLGRIVTKHQQRAGLAGRAPRI